MKRLAPLQTQRQAISREENTIPVSGEDLPLVLVVEDNSDVVSYLSACLEGHYRLEVAYDGQSGIEKGIERVPDLVISDVMMPRKDGFEVCLTLKSDTRTSHIPLVLLTAKADIESRLQGLEHGADVYLPKPFNKTELLVQLRRLLELRQRLQAHYLALAGASNAGELELGEKEENEFVLRIRRKVEEHLSDPGFSVDRLCREMAMSNSQLQRKLNALTGFAPNHFIRYIRMLDAQRLLKNTTLTVAEIAFQTGFEDPAYFTRAFKKEFGVTPTGYREG
ncbi:MAG: helix-turn-helix domain-containing protein [Saprospirales bacterium]|nr:helix-turn-helix domain-containing protein [Saprospirales bacterium]